MLALFAWFFFFLAWIQPHHFRPWLNFYSEALAIAAIVLLAWSNRYHHRWRTPEKTPRTAAIVAAIAILPWLSWTLGVTLYAGDALLNSLYLTAMAIAIALGYQYSTSHHPKISENLPPVFHTLWLSALISAAVGLVQWLSLSDAIGMMYISPASAGDRALGNMGQPNQLATLLLMGSAALAWAYEKNKLSGWVVTLALVFISAVLVLTQSRTGIVSVGALLVFALLKYKNFQKIRFLHVALWVALYFVLTYFLPYLSDALLMSERRNLSLIRDNGRLIMWQQTLAGVLESPWLGYGWNQAPSAHAVGSLAYPGRLTFTNAHNMFVDILAWCGIPLGITLIGLILYWMISRTLKIRQGDAILAMAALIPLFLHSMLEYPFAYAYFLMAAGLLIGIIEADKNLTTKTVSTPGMLTTAGLVVMSLVGVRIVYEATLVEEDFRVVRFENMRIGSTPSEYKPPANIYFLSQQRAMLEASRMRPHREMSEADITTLKKAAFRFPYGGLNIRYAIALGLNGQPEAATRQMQVVRGMFGDFYYRAAVESLRLEQEKYPELERVKTP